MSEGDWFAPKKLGVGRRPADHVAGMGADDRLFADRSSSRNVGAAPSGDRDRRYRAADLGLLVLCAQTHAGRMEMALERRRIGDPVDNARGVARRAAPLDRRAWRSAFRAAGPLAGR